MAVSIYPSDRSHPPKENSLAALGVDVVEESLAEHLARPENRYDAVVVSRPHNADLFLELLRGALPDAQIIYDAEALYHKRLVHSSAARGGRRKAQAPASRSGAMERVEAHVARFADAVVAISHEERDWLEAVPDHAPVELMVPLLSAIEMGPADPAAREDAVFVAGWLGGDDSPNVDALRWYCREVLPHVRALLPGFRTLVTGKNPPLSVAQLADEDVVLLGFVTSIRDLYNAARIAIAPDPHGRRREKQNDGSASIRRTRRSYGGRSRRHGFERRPGDRRHRRS